MRAEDYGIRKNSDRFAPNVCDKLLNQESRIPARTPRPGPLEIRTPHQVFGAQMEVLLSRHHQGELDCYLAAQRLLKQTFEAEPIDLSVENLL